MFSIHQLNVFAFLLNLIFDFLSKESYFLFSQNPPMQSSYPVEFLPSNWPCSATDENKKTEVNLEAVFQIVDELHSSPKLEMVKVEPVENQCSTSQSNRSQHILANSNNSNPSSTSQASQLEPLTPVGSDITSFVVGTEQAITSSLPQSPEYIYTIHPAQPVENTTMQESAINQQAHIKLKEQLSHNPAASSVVFVQEGLPFSTHQVRGKEKFLVMFRDTWCFLLRTVVVGTLSQFYLGLIRVHYAFQKDHVPVVLHKAFQKEVTLTVGLALTMLWFE